MLRQFDISIFLLACGCHFSSLMMFFQENLQQFNGPERLPLVVLRCECLAAAYSVGQTRKVENGSRAAAIARCGGG